MRIDTAILGYLGWKPMTGYDLKKLFSSSPLFHWSGSSNQVYRALVRLHRDGLLDLAVEQQESLPPRKVYSLTEAGRRALREQVAAEPELPTTRSSFLAQLAWADVLSEAELDALCADYQSEVESRLAMVREQLRRGIPRPDRTERERYLWEQVAESHLRSLRTELEWIRDVRAGLPGGGAR